MVGGDHAGRDLKRISVYKIHRCADPQHPSDDYRKVQETTSRQEQEVVRVCVTQVSAQVVWFPRRDGG